ncbi:MAG: hypothetical protein QNK34_02665, partial [Woeseiaceae bacterium]|nr:hypothetical protein [Woeseiaceae bacterium]
QLFVALALARISKALADERLHKAARFLVAICVVTFCLSILNSVLKLVLEDAGASENRIEWIASVLIQSYFFVLFLAWRSTDMTTLVRVRKPGVG